MSTGIQVDSECFHLAQTVRESLLRFAIFKISDDCNIIEPEYRSPILYPIFKVDGIPSHLNFIGGSSGYLGLFPPDILQMFIGLLDYESLRKMSTVSKYWYYQLVREYIWKERVLKDCPSHLFGAIPMKFEVETVSSYRKCYARWMSFHKQKDKLLNDSKCGISKSWEDLIQILPPDEARYVLFNLDWEGTKKLIFVMWTPDIQKVKMKLVYAACKEFLKTKLLGMSLELQATDLDEISYSELLDKLARHMLWSEV